MPCKLVFFYNQGGSGFSETYYVSGSDPKAAVNALTYTTLVNMSYWRHPACSLWAVRASTTVLPRLSFTQTYAGYYRGAGIVGAFDLRPDVYSTDAVVRLSGVGSHNRRVYFRGLKDQDVNITNLNVPQPSAFLAAGIGHAAQAMKTQGFQIRYTLLPPDGGLLWHGVSLVEPSALSPFVTNLIVGPAVSPLFTKGQQILIRGADSRALPRFPRTAMITGIDPIGGKLQVNYAIPGGVNLIQPKLQLTHLTYSYDPIDNYILERFSEHKTGRFFGQLRGRSRSLRAGPI
jgi:hypothetical protein